MAGIPSLCHLLDSSFPRTRESRFGLRPISLDTRFRGYDGTQVTSSLWETIALHLFSKQARRTRRVRIIKIPNFVLFVSFVVKTSATLTLTKTARTTIERPPPIW
jgi:hypothetical protein